MPVKSLVDKARKTASVELAICTGKDVPCERKDTETAAKGVSSVAGEMVPSERNKSLVAIPVDGSIVTVL